MSSEWSQKTLAEMLDAKQVEEVGHIIQSIRMGADPVTLREYLVTQRESLEQRGVVPEYLYYALCYKFDLMR